MNEHTSNPIIEMSGVSKWFGDFQVLKEVDLQVFSENELWSVDLLALASPR